MIKNHIININYNTIITYCLVRSNMGYIRRRWPEQDRERAIKPKLINTIFIPLYSTAPEAIMEDFL